MQAETPSPVEVADLLPCPFCGSADVLIITDEDSDGRFAAVGCNSCGAGSRQHYFCGDDAREYAAGAWNTRALRDRDALQGSASDTDLRERVAAIIDANKYLPWTVDRAGQMADEILALIRPYPAVGNVELAERLERSARDYGTPSDLLRQAASALRHQGQERGES